MYKRDVALISEHALSSPEGMSDALETVLLTIQQPLSRLVASRRDVSINGEQSVFLFGSKRRGWAYINQYREDLHKTALAILEAPESLSRDTELVDHFMQVPGIGMVKSGFVCQMLGVDVSCLDMHNLNRLGVPISKVKVGQKVKPETRLKRVKDYIKLTRETGGAEYWWNSWCEWVAGGRMNKLLPTADDVSAYHVEAVLYG